LGEQKLNNFSTGGAKFDEKQPRQSSAKYNLMQNNFFKKRYIQCMMGLGQSPQKLGSFREFWS